MEESAIEFWDRQGTNSVRYEASRAPKNAGPWPNSPPRPTAWPGVRRVFLGFPAPVPGPARSPGGSPLKHVGRNGPHPGNERGLTPDVGGAGITLKITPAARCKGGAW